MSDTSYITDKDINRITNQTMVVLKDSSKIANAIMIVGDMPYQSSMDNPNGDIVEPVDGKLVIVTHPGKTPIALSPQEFTDRYHGMNHLKGDEMIEGAQGEELLESLHGTTAAMLKKQPIQVNQLSQNQSQRSADSSSRA